MGSFVSGLIQGNVDQATKMRKAGKGGILRKKKRTQGSGETPYEGTLQFKRGGKVKRTGLAKVHRGERVLTKRQSKRYTKRR
jgi:hypothetical protein